MYQLEPASPTLPIKTWSKDLEKLYKLSASINHSLLDKIIQLSKVCTCSNAHELNECNRPNVHVLNESKRTRTLGEALHMSCKEGLLNVVKYLVEHIGADINYKYEETFTPLLSACKYERLDVVKYLLNNPSVDVSLTGTYQRTPLLSACFDAKTAVSTCLLLNAMNDLKVNVSDELSNTALHYAIARSKDEGYTQLHKPVSEVI